jgi:putative ABC transport system permease protein
MFKLLRENIRIATGSIKTQLLRTVLTVLIIAIGITALVGILTVVSALEYTISGKFASMGANTFNITQYDFSEQIDGDGDGDDKPHPIITYPQAKAFTNTYKFPNTHASISFTATRAAEVKFPKLPSKALMKITCKIQVPK